MAEKYKDKDRVIFPKLQQQQFFKNLGKNFSVSKMAQLCSCSERTIRDWRRGKFFIRMDALKILCRVSKQPFPKNVKIREQYWYTSLGASRGAHEVLKKYGYLGGDPELRKKKWREWWEREGKHKPRHVIFSARQIRKPSYSKKLAEFVGIVLGDGGIAPRQVTITLHKHDDKEYGYYICKLIRPLFNVPVSVRPHPKDNATQYTVSRTELVRFCTNNLGLTMGNKVAHQVGVPRWVAENKTFRIACLRGLVDTDGSVFVHRYAVKGKEYAYKKLSFTNRSFPLLDFVFDTFKSLGLHPRQTKRGEVRLDSKSDMCAYFLLVGSHNPKHLKRYYH
ncbi:MAG: hypothetical protein HYY92_01525 [Parcubacteria group bacterium]|nr:hypothetical protein [Parcubacteria group bacterium]